jgi:hypothetical protein
VQHDAHAERSSLPRGLTAGETPTDDVNHEAQGSSSGLQEDPEARSLES